MADNDTTREFHDELVSAYLDGELSTAERLRVEERLAVDPVARQTLEELRSVSQALQGLPRKQLGEDLRTAILRRAEQETLASAKQPAAEAAAVSDNAVSTIGPPQFTVGRTRRGWVWAAMAVAAALVIMFLERGGEQGGKVRDVAARDARESKPADNGTAFNAPSHRLLTESPPKLTADAEVEKPQINDISQLGVDGVARPTPAQPGMSTSPVPGATESNFRFKQSNEQLVTKESNKSESDVNLRDKLAADDATKRMTADDVGERGRQEAKFEPDSRPLMAIDETRTAPPMTAAGTSAAKGELTETHVAANERLPGGVAPAPAAPNAISLKTIADSPTPAKREDLLVVYVDVKSQSLRNRAIDQQLIANGIALENAATHGSSVSGGSDVSKTSEAVVFHDVNADWFGVKGSQPNDPSNTDAILVDAPPAQLSGLLAALDADADNVLRISIDNKDLAGDAAKATELAWVDWSKLKRANVPEEMRRYSEQAGGRNSGLATTSDTSSGDPQAARFGGGRGRAGGGAAGVGARRGGRGAARGGRGGGAAPSSVPASGGESAAMGPRGGGGGGGQPQGMSQSGEQQPLAKDTVGNALPDNSTAEGRIASQQQSGGGIFGGRATVSDAERMAQSARVAAAEVARGDGATDAKQMLGRARRVVVAPQAELRELKQAEEVSQDSFKRDVAAYQNAEQTGGEKPTGAAMSTSSTAAGIDASGNRAAAAGGVDDQSSLSRLYTRGADVAGPVMEQPVDGQPRGGSSGRGSTSSTAPTADRGGEKIGEGLQDVGQAGANQSARTRSLRVLFVFRAQPDSAATPAATPAQPPTSLPAADPAK